jgi:hypothetical protein
MINRGSSCGSREGVCAVRLPGAAGANSGLHNPLASGTNPSGSLRALTYVRPTPLASGTGTVPGAYFQLSLSHQPITTSMPFKKNLTVAVIGPAGMTGSYTVVELLNRGHSVVGISRNPSAIGKHDRYKAIPVDFDNSSISEIAKSFEGVDAVVKCSLPLW